MSRIQAYGSSAQFVPDEVAFRLSSLIDGEGCFSISRKTRGWTCELIVKMRLDDRPLLERFRRELGDIGTICQGQPAGEGRRRPWTRWSVARKAETLWLTELLDVYPLWSKKRRDYEVWREAVIAHFCGATDLSEYVVEIRAAREYEGRVEA